MRIFVGAAGGLLGVFLAAAAHAHGVVGQRSFIEPFITEDVNPKNELVVARPEWDTARDGRTFSLGYGLEKKVSDRFSITLDSAWLDVSPNGAGEPHASGADDLGVTLKYAFFVSPAHEAIVSAAVESTAPTGVRAAGAEPAWAFKPFLLYGKGAGDLPDALAYLRPLAIQGDVGYEVALDHGRTTALQHDVAVEYSIPYLQQAVRDFGIPWPLSDLIADVELDFENGAHATGRGDNPVIVTPGIVYMDRWVELGVAGRFPLNARANDGLGYGVVGIVDLFIDDIFPWTKWQPF
ncbi:MAG TPA: hypothetical protein VKW76_09695 [Candidatus Binatia bacterium]|nr:hypothetical protein [Candidatus Binatia bacterium]